MKIKEWAEKNKKKLAIAGVIVAGGIGTYFTVKAGKSYQKKLVEHAQEGEAILKALANNCQDLPKPDWNAWHVEEFWTQKDMPVSMNMIVNRVPISDIGKFGEKLVSDCGASANSAVDLILAVYED